MDECRDNASQGFRLVVTAAVVMLAASCSVPNSTPVKGALQERITKVDTVFNITPVRGDKRPLRLHRDGDEIECSFCHETFPEDTGLKALETEHKEIKFDHGLNQRCLNCHNPKNANTYINYDGSEIPDDQPTRLCAKCHGPHYREWMLGIHGRINGGWNGKLQEQKRLDCIQCHDPHRPRFQPMAPLPPTILTRFEHGPDGGSSHE